MPEILFTDGVPVNCIVQASSSLFGRSRVVYGPMMSKPKKQRRSGARTKIAATQNRPAEAAKKAERMAAEREALMAAISYHLRVVRDVLGLAQNEFGAMANLEPNTYNQIELGKKMPSIHTAIAICAAHKLTLDYFFLGATGDLQKPVRDAVDAIMAARARDT